MTKTPLVVDTCIISHALNQNKKAAYAAYFKTLESKFKFIVTGYTQYELTCSSDKENRIKILEYIENDMSYVELSETLMNNAARVFYLYSKHSSTIGKKISAGDIINASVAIALNCPLLTIDNNDYPRPFFQDDDRGRVTYNTNKNKETTDTVYILKPDMLNIKQCFEDHKV